MESVEDDTDQGCRSNEIQGLPAEHARVIALRLKGKRWSEIAAELGVTPWTVWNWRQENPEIDEIIAQESQDYLDASKHALAQLVPLANAALRTALTEADSKDRIAAVRVVLEVFKKPGESAQQAGDRIRRAAKLDDGELDARLDAALSAAARPAAKPR